MDPSPQGGVNAIPQKKAYHHKDLRSALVEAGRLELATKGVSGLSMRQVARMAGVSHTAPYRHFVDKSELLVAIAQEGYLDLQARLEDVYKVFMDDPIKQLLAAGNAYLEFCLANEETVHLMFGGTLNSARNFIDLERASSAAFGSLIKIIENGKCAGLFRDLPSNDIGLSVWSMVHGISMLTAARQLEAVVKDEAHAQEIGRVVANLLLRGLLNPGGLRDGQKSPQD